MEFINRNAKCKKIQKTDMNGVPLPEAFYALITDEVTQEGTPLNAEAMNKLSLGIDAFDNLANLKDASTGSKGSLQNILDNSFNIHTSSCTAKQYDNLELTVSAYDERNIKALDYDICGELILTCNKPNPSSYGIFDLRDPTTGQKNFLQDIINNLFNLMTERFTTNEYDGMNINAAVYDNKNITALNFDMRGKSLLI